MLNLMTKFKSELRIGLPCDTKQGKFVKFERQMRKIQLKKSHSERNKNAKINL